MNELYKKSNFLNPDIPFIFNNTIIEYDMEEAGYNLGREYGLFKDHELKKLSENTKANRKIIIGKMERDNKKFKELHQASFELARKEFINRNELDNSEIISIKKDAIITTRVCSFEKVGEYINFREKNRYSSYVNLNIRKLELYYNSMKIDVKGISDEKLKLHEDYMLDIINKFFKSMEKKSIDKTISMMRRFIDKYKAKELPLNYYRRFDSFSEFQVIIDQDFYDENNISVDDIDIGYNLLILLKLIKVCLIEGRQSK